MADPELASKLARRLESVDEAPTDGPKAVVPPPVPKMPEKVVPNPYVAADDSVSIDDLIAKAMERKEHREENNNVATSDSITMDEGHVAMATANGSDSQPNHSGVPPKRSLADLLAKDQERPASPPHASPAGTAAKQAPPPKTTIGELLVKDKRPLSPPPTNKCPIIPVQHHVPKPEVRRKSPEDDGSELERKLAAQRAKKSQTVVPAPETNVIFSSSQNSSPSPHTLPQVGEPETKPVPKSDEAETSSLPAETEKAPPAEVPKKPARAVDLEKHSPGQESEKPPTGPIEVHVPEATLEEVKAEAGSEAERQKSELSSAESDEPRKPVVQETEATSAQAEPVEKSPPPPPLPSTEPPALKDSSVRETDVPPQLEQIKMPPPPPPPSLEPPALGPLNETDLKNLLVDEVKRCKITKEEMIVIKDMELRKEESARPFSPTKELIEMIQHENGIRSPPPIPPPKPQTPSHSRPQSPVVKLFFYDGCCSSPNERLKS